MTSNTKVKRIRWMAALTLILLFLSLLSPILLRVMPKWLPDISIENPGPLMKWGDEIQLIYAGLHLIMYACIVVFFVRMLHGLGRGKIFVPGNARWLYIGAWIPITNIAFAVTFMFFLYGCSGVAIVAQFVSIFYNLAMFSAITLMALLYDVATDVSEENQLTV